MTFRRRQLLGWSLLLAVALAGGEWLRRIDYRQKISTDVLDLIPAEERTPELTLVRSLASQAEARTMFLELTGAKGAPVSDEAARHFVSRLAREAAFDQVLFMGDGSARDALGQELFAQRFRLLFPRWLSEHRAAHGAAGGTTADFPTVLARTAVGELSQFLATPEAMAFQELVPADPLLLMPKAAERLKGGLALMPSADDTASATLVWARLSASPLSEAGQAPAFAAIERATAAVRADFPGFQVASTGVNRFAAASRARIEKEVTWLNLASLVAVLAVAFTFIRGAHRGLHLLPVVLFSFLGAWVCTTLAFDRIHIMVFVVGSLLTGVAIDYGFYLFMQPPMFPGEDYWSKVRRLKKPLLASCLTTVAGFALLLFSELPFIRQLGAFVGAGLISALGAAVIYFSTVRDPFLAARAFRGGPFVSASRRKEVRRWLTVAWVSALPGLAFLSWRDDIRELDIPSPELNREHARISALFGNREDHTVYLTYGSNLSEARESLAKLEGWLATNSPGSVQSTGLGAIVPTTAEQTDAALFVSGHPEFPGQLRSALKQGGFDDTAFDSFFDAYAIYAGSSSADDTGLALKALQTKMVGPVGLLLHSGKPLSWFVTLVRQEPAGAPPADAHTVTAGQLQSLNRIFSRYRQSAMWLSLIGLAIVGAGVFFTYGWRDGARIFAIPCGACLGLFGLFGWIGQPLNLFHLLGAFLGVCLTHNYSIFTATSAYRREAPPVSVRMSALTTAASFGVLAMSGIPVVRALGSTVALMVIAALLVIEFEHLAILGKRT